MPLFEQYKLLKTAISCNVIIACFFKYIFYVDGSSSPYPFYILLVKDVRWPLEGKLNLEFPLHFPLAI